jgi:hypothetical protein
MAPFDIEGPLIYGDQLFPPSRQRSDIHSSVQSQEPVTTNVLGVQPDGSRGFKPLTSGYEPEMPHIWNFPYSPFYAHCTFLAWQLSGKYFIAE